MRIDLNMNAEKMMYSEHSVNGTLSEYTLSSLSLLLLLY